MRLSIIIPIYKSERWIGRCLDSIYSQGIEEALFEVICIIDGSPDNSIKVVRERQVCHNNLVIVEQDNNGVSMARNRGIDESRGDYVMFVDSDDTFFEHSLSEILSSLASDDAEIIVTRCFTKEYEWVPWNHLFNDGDIIKTDNAIKKGYLRGCVWGACYNRRFIIKNSIRFVEKVSNGEDSLFFMTCMYFAHAIMFKDVKLYNVVEECGSLSRTYNEKKVYDIIGYLPILDNYLNRIPVIKNKTFVFQYVRYSWLSALVLRTIRTKGVGLHTLKKAKISKYANFTIDNDVIVLRKKMKIMKWSFSLFYLLTWIKERTLR